MNARDMMAYSLSWEGRKAAQEFLSSAKEADARMALLTARLNDLRKAGARPVSAEEEQAVRTERERLRARRRAVEEAVRRVPDGLCRAVLEGRYLQRLPFFRIAMALSYTERQVYRFHRRGLQHIALQIASGCCTEETQPADAPLNGARRSP